MTRQTRYFVLGANGLLLVGLCAGLFAFLSRGPALVVPVNGAEEFSYVPADASVLAYANVREVMLSDVRTRIRQVSPNGVGQQQLEQYLGLNLEEDIDHVIAFLAPGSDQGRPAGLVLFRGRFDLTRLEEVARAAGATVDTYNGTRLVSVDTGDAGTLAMGFMEPGLVAVGDLGTVQLAADRRSGGADITSNSQMMALIERVDVESNVWAFGRFGDLGNLGLLADGVLEGMPAVSAFVVSGHVNGGLGGSLALEGSDETVGQNLRDAFRGFVALAQAFTAGDPAWQTMVESLQLGGVGTAMTLSFRVPSEALDFVFALVQGEAAF